MIIQNTFQREFNVKQISLCHKDGRMLLDTVLASKDDGGAGVGHTELRSNCAWSAHHGTPRGDVSVHLCSGSDEF